MATAEASVIELPQDTVVEGAVPFAALAVHPDDPPLRSLVWHDGEDELDAFRFAVVQPADGSTPFVLMAYANDPVRSVTVLADPAGVQQGELDHLLRALRIGGNQVLGRVDEEPAVAVVADVGGRGSGTSHTHHPRPTASRPDDTPIPFIVATVRNVDHRLWELQAEVAKLEAARAALVGSTAAKATLRRSARRDDPATTARKRGRRRSGNRRPGATRADQALELVRKQPGISIPELAQAMEIQPSYLYRVLPKLVEQGSVRRVGQGWTPGSSEKVQR